MRVKTWVTLSSSLLEEIDRQNSNRSAFLEHAASFYLAQTGKRLRKANDAAILERRFEKLNREAEDVLDYQALPESVKRGDRDFELGSACERDYICFGVKKR